MSENNGWKPMEQEEIARHVTMPNQEFYVGANGRPATSEAAAQKSLDAATEMQPDDVTDYLRTILDDNGGARESLSFNEKYGLNNEIGLLGVIPKQDLPKAFKRISSMLEKYSGRVKDPAKLDQVRHYLNTFGQTEK